MNEVSSIKTVAGSGGGCFRKGTQVQLEHGKTIAIEQLVEGDEVLAFDESGKLHVSKVTKVHYHENPQPVIQVKYWGGDVHITPNHWVLNQYGAFTEIGKMSTHDALVDGMGHLRPIIDAAYVSHEPVYNLTVEPHHTFIADGIRVHNGGHRDRYPVIAGSGGGGGGKGGAHTPVEDSDSLQSRAMIALLDLVGEGEVGGLVNGAQSIYLDNTPLQNPDGSYNFLGVSWDTRTGTQGQSPILGFSDVDTPYNVSVQVKQSVPHTVTITNPNVDQVRVIVTTPGLSTTDLSTGDTHGTSVQYQFAISTNGGAFVSTPVVTVTGKTRGKYQRSHLLTLPKPGTQWQISMTRITADSTNSNLSNDTYFDSYVEIVNAKMSYPNSALVAVRIDSSQFNSIPNRSYRINGLYIKVPTNYNPVTRLYTGVWDGTFKVAVSNNPAWVMYDLLTSHRYGLGEYLTAAQVDKTSLYQIGRYCDELVSNGFGGTEPRFTLNTAIQVQAEAYKLISDISSVFRGMTYWSGGLAGFTQDAPTSPSMVYTAANVIDGLFNYVGSSKKDRHSAVLVSWNDPAEYYMQKTEYVEDADLVAKYGIRKMDTIAFACTSRGQANRVGRWILYTEKYESNLVSFTVGIDSSLVLPGEVVKIHDANRAGKRMGGRLAQYVAPRTNLLTYSEQLDNVAAWTASSGGAVTANTTIAPDGNLTADTITDSSTTAYGYIDNIVTVPSNSATYTFSTYLKQGTAAESTIISYLLGGTTPLGGGFYTDITWATMAVSTNCGGTVTAVGGGWYRVTSNITNNNTGNVSLYSRIAPSGIFSTTVTGTVIAWGAQLEVASAATAYIPTGSTKVSTITSATLDAPVVIDSAAIISLQMPDGTFADSTLLQSPSTTGYTVVTWAATLTQIPLPNAIWLVSELNLEPMLARVVGVSQGTEPGTFNITAMQHNESKYNAIDFGMKLETPQLSAIDLGSAVVLSLPQVDETPYQTSPGALGLSLDVTWQGAASSYSVTWSRTVLNLSNPVTVVTSTPYLKLDNVLAGTYNFSVTGINTFGKRSQPLVFTHATLGKTAAPGDVINFKVTKRTSDLLLTWDQATGINLLGYEIRTGASWDAGAAIITNFAGTMITHDQSAAGNYNYFIRSISVDGTYSYNVTSFTLALLAPAAVQQFNCIQNGSRIELRWDQNLETDIVSYEIREGATWSSSVFLTQVKSTTYSTPSNSLPGVRTFWIKAISSPGIYSVAAAFSNTSIATPTDRNIVLLDDEVANGWLGSKFNVSVMSGALQVDLGKIYGEYTWPVSLPATFLARNSIGSTFDAVTPDTTIWQTASYVWSDPLASRAWTVAGDISTVKLNYYISKYVGLDPSYLEGFGLNQVVTGILGTVAATAVGVSYGPGRFLTGAVIGDFTTLDWNLAVPAQFNTTLWAIPQVIGGNQVYWSGVTATGLKLIAGHDAINNWFYLEDTLGQKITVPYAVSVNDRVLIGIVQTATTRRLYVGALAQASANNSAAFVPIGALTKISLHQ
jgi:predicted phage tail protein